MCREKEHEAIASILQASPLSVKVTSSGLKGWHSLISLGHYKATAYAGKIRD
jgi:hypothetical protein